MSIESEIAKLTAAIEANTAALLQVGTGAPAAAAAPAEEAKPAAKPKAKTPEKAKPAKEPAPEPEAPAEETPPAEDTEAKRKDLVDFLRGKLAGAEDKTAAKLALDEIGKEFEVKGVKDLADDQIDAFRAAAEERLG